MRAAAHVSLEFMQVGFLPDDPQLIIQRMRVSHLPGGQYVLPSDAKYLFNKWRPEGCAFLVDMDVTNGIFSILPTSQYVPLTVYCLLLTAYCSLRTAYCSPFTTICSLLTVHCLPLTDHSLPNCSLLTAHCSLLTTG